jgi:NAD(P)H-hydrate epimerase
MAGATILSGQGALRSGIGLLRIVAAAANATAIHAAVPAALFQQWPATPSELTRLTESSDVIAIGPGLGNSPLTRDLVERILLAWNGPVVIDADGLNVFAGDLASLADLLGGRPAIITPHPAEMGRLIGVSTDEVLAQRFEIGTSVAARLGAAILLKGTPTVVFSPGGERFVSAAGTAALATGGSGDVLTGIASTLLAQMSGERRSAEAAACAAFTHGLAAELCGPVRGTTLDDVLYSLRDAWTYSAEGLRAGILAQLEAHQ